MTSKHTEVQNKPDKYLRGTYVRNITTKQIVRIMGEVGGHESASHWGRDPRGDGSEILLDPYCGNWADEPTGSVCDMCGATPSVPMELHSCMPEDKLLHHAKRVVDYDWSDNDSDAVDAIAALRAVVREVEGYERLPPNTFSNATY